MYAWGMDAPALNLPKGDYSGPSAVLPIVILGICDISIISHLHW
jgi:hypothetical protein